MQLPPRACLRATLASGRRISERRSAAPGTDQPAGARYDHVDDLDLVLVGDLDLLRNLYLLGKGRPLQVELEPVVEIGREVEVGLEIQLGGPHLVPLQVF